MKYFNESDALVKIQNSCAEHTMISLLTVFNMT